MRYEIFTPDRFILGTVGAPGERAFYIQAKKEKQIFSVAIEKDQVRAIVARLEMIFAGIKRANPFEIADTSPVDDQPLESPVDAEFQIGAMSLAWDEQTSLICIELYELEEDKEESDGEVTEIYITIGMAAAFSTRSKAVVNAGRLPCPFCGIPIDPRGHLCPRANGYRR